LWANYLSTQSFPNHIRFNFFYLKLLHSKFLKQKTALVRPKLKLSEHLYLKPFESRNEIFLFSNLIPTVRITCKSTQPWYYAKQGQLPLKITAIWYQTMLVRFIEKSTGFKAAITFNPFLEDLITLKTHTQLLL
jgi:hypothetical protein